MKLITKEDWLRIRSQEEWPMELFFEFYKEKGGVVTNLFEFGKLFNSLAITRQIIFADTNGNDIIREVSFETAIHKMTNHYDTKFATGCKAQEARRGS